MGDEYKLELGKYLSGKLVKKLGKVLYEEAIKPAAQEYVDSTENDFDNSALAFLDSFVGKWLEAE